MSFLLLIIAKWFSSFYRVPNRVNIFFLELSKYKFENINNFINSLLNIVSGY